MLLQVDALTNSDDDCSCSFVGRGSSDEVTAGATDAGSPELGSAHPLMDEQGVPARIAPGTAHPPTANTMLKTERTKLALVLVTCTILSTSFWLQAPSDYSITPRVLAGVVLLLQATKTTTKTTTTTTS